MPNTTSPLHLDPGPAPPSEEAVVGTLLRQLVLAIGPLNVLQVGCPDPSAVVALASALSENRQGRLVCCEPETARARAAAAAIEEARLGRYAEVRVGSPERVLPGVSSPVDLLLLGGEPESYLPLVTLLEPRMLPGAVIVAEGVRRFAKQCGQFLAHLRLPGSGYVSMPLPFGAGLELAVCAR
ncbi:O-methyltransferase [Streptomyces yaanensis]|uniref:O-methyltransferase n=1 Tax=Streptomyces yaanensis TaxID=1142239 RepID=A0ABV7SJC3_9ACTN|nr:class I SAM-dependent methyltransferase [Streptomyces sp. CGMCC 4.7035]WNC00997.1 class I SAM-dependent methyltransferase [Streptomyces sp. CGMCC 4.7035]